MHQTLFLALAYGGLEPHGHEHIKKIKKKHGIKEIDAALYPCYASSPAVGFFFSYPCHCSLPLFVYDPPSEAAVELMVVVCTMDNGRPMEM